MQSLMNFTLIVVGQMTEKKNVNKIFSDCLLLLTVNECQSSDRFDLRNHNHNQFHSRNWNPGISAVPQVKEPLLSEQIGSTCRHYRPLGKETNSDEKNSVDARSQFSLQEER